MKRSAGKSFVTISAALAALCLAAAAQGQIVFEVRILSVKGPGLTVNNPHSVSVTAVGGTINFGVFAVITPGGPPAPDDGFQSARGYLMAGLPAGAGNVPLNNGPIGNLTSGIMVAPFNANGSVGPPGSGASLTTTAAVDLNGNTFTDFGNLTNDVNLDLIPRSGSMTTNAANGANGSSFLFFTFSMPVTSLGADRQAGTTRVAFTCNAKGISVGYAEAGVARNGNDGIGDSIPVVLTNGKVIEKKPAPATTSTRPK